MTEEQKEILIAKMLDSPSSLSHEELDAILHDNELREIYNVSSAVSGACIRQPEMNIAEEWTRFRPRIHRKSGTKWWIMRIAAIFLGVAFVAGIATKMTNHFLTPTNHPVIAGVPQKMPLTSPPTVKLQPDMPPSESQGNPTFQSTILTNPDPKPGQPMAKIKTDKSKKVETPPKIDIDEYIRIQQARIDNDLAMQIAEYYTDEYSILMPIFDAVGTYYPEIDQAIRKVTMQ